MTEILDKTSRQNINWTLLYKSKLIRVHQSSIRSRLLKKKTIVVIQEETLYKRPLTNLLYLPFIQLVTMTVSKPNQSIYVTYFIKWYKLYISVTKSKYKDITFKYMYMCLCV